MDVTGSPEYVLTWKHWDMQSGPPILALRARARRTSDSDFGGWPTPMAGNPGTDTYNPAGNTDYSRKTEALAGWASPSATTWGGTAEQHLERKRKAIVAGHSMGLVVSCLDQQGQMAGWATPTCVNYRSPKSNQHGKNSRPLQEQAGLTTGPSDAATGRYGVLAPEFSRWLMGFPSSWDRAAPNSSDWESVQLELTASVGSGDTGTR
jgi:hypothetical protein